MPRPKGTNLGLISSKSWQGNIRDVLLETEEMQFLNTCMTEGLLFCRRASHEHAASSDL